MLKNYAAVAWRFLRRNKAYSILNILGLTLGLASCLIIFLIVRYELGYDGFHHKAVRIYRVTLHGGDDNPSVSMAVAPALRTYFPDLEQVSQVWFHESGLVKAGQNRFEEKGVAGRTQFGGADGEHVQEIFRE